jgi:hypothetical protein
MLNSVQHTVRDLLDGLVIPGSTQTLEAYITPPTVDTLDNPKAFILAARLRGSRQTMPRGLPGQAGFKKLPWQVDIFLSYETTPDSATVDEEFPLVIDAVLMALWQAAMPVFMIDPTTGLKTQLVAIGEEFELEYPPEKVPATLRMLYYTARIGVTAYEAVQV